MTQLQEQWQEVYDMLGLGSEFREFILKIPTSNEPLDESSLPIFVIAGVTVAKIITALNKKRIEIVDDKAVLARCENLCIKRSYLVYSDRRKEVVAVRTTSEGKYLESMNIQEYLLYNLWRLVANKGWTNPFRGTFTIILGTNIGGLSLEMFFSFENVKVYAFEGTYKSEGDGCNPRIYAP